MGLTKTQRNFKKQIKEIRKEGRESIYDTYWDRGKYRSFFVEHKTVSVGTIISIVFFIIYVVRFFLR